MLGTKVGLRLLPGHTDTGTWPCRASAGETGRSETGTWPCRASAGDKGRSEAATWPYRYCFLAIRRLVSGHIGTGAHGHAEPVLGRPVGLRLLSGHTDTCTWPYRYWYLAIRKLVPSHTDTGTWLCSDWYLVIQILVPGHAETGTWSYRYWYLAIRTLIRGHTKSVLRMLPYHANSGTWLCRASAGNTGRSETGCTDGQAFADTCTTHMLQRLTSPEWPCPTSRCSFFSAF